MKVLISLECRTRYSTIVEMEEADYQRLNQEIDSPSYRTADKAKEQLFEWINPRTDWQSDEVSDVEEFKPYLEDNDSLVVPDTVGPNEIL